MKIVIVGASGTVGSAVSELLAKDHQVIRVGHSRGDATVDMRDPASIKALFAKLGQFDALIVASGSVAFNGLTEMTMNFMEAAGMSIAIGKVCKSPIVVHFTAPNRACIHGNPNNAQTTNINPPKASGNANFEGGKPRPPSIICADA